MLAKLKTFSLVGIDALPVEVEVDVSPSGLPKQGPRRPAGGRGQGEHAPRRAGDRQLGLSAAAKPRGHQPGPRRSAYLYQLVFSQDTLALGSVSNASTVVTLLCPLGWSFRSGH